MRLTTVLMFSCLAMASEFPVGSKLPDLALNDHGKAVTIRAGKAQATALIFVSATCEVTESYSDRLKRLDADYSAKNVDFAFIDANDPESAAQIDAYAKAHGWKFKVYKDDSNRLADTLDAHVTPEVFLFDKGGILAYRGRVDDSRNALNVKTIDARTALDAVLSGKTPPVTETKAFGCTITRAKQK